VGEKPAANARSTVVLSTTLCEVGLSEDLEVEGVMVGGCEVVMINGGMK